MNNNLLFNPYLNNNINPYSNHTYQFDIKGLDKLKDTITLNGIKYRLDSVILGNYNLVEISGGHHIAGITCNNNHYVYNGWDENANIFDDSINKIKIKNTCPLIKFNWNIHKDIKFNLNNKLCKLDFIKNDNNDLCFSFNKGERTFIYAKISNKNIKINRNSNSKNNIDLSNMSSVIENIYNPNKLTKNEILNFF